MSESVKKQQVIALWRTIFNDTEEFIRFYFDRKYRDEDALVYEENGEPLAALQMLPYPMTWAGTEINTSYISGACTLESARNKGFMKKLLTDAFSVMKAREIVLSTLIPAEFRLFDYYGKLGYATVFSYSLERYTLPTGDKTPTGIATTAIENHEQTIRKLYPWISGQQKKHSCAIQHTLEDFEIIVQDLYLSGGKLITATDSKGKLCGVAFANSDKNHVWTNELLYDSDFAKQALLYKIAEIFGTNQIVCTEPSSGKDRISQGMARIVDAGQMLTYYARRYPEKSFSLQLTDHQIADNCGYYMLDKGHCSKPNYIGKTDFQMDISTLTQALLGYETAQIAAIFTVPGSRLPFMNLMLE